ncbi:MAG: hypothetical protein ABH879_05890 [archaeon]
MDPSNVYFNQRVLDLGLKPEETPLYKHDWLVGLAETGKLERRHIPSAEYWGLSPRQRLSTDREPSPRDIVTQPMERRAAASSSVSSATAARFAMMRERMRTEQERTARGYESVFGGGLSFFYDVGPDTDGDQLATIIAGGPAWHENFGRAMRSGDFSGGGMYYAGNFFMATSMQTYSEKGPLEIEEHIAGAMRDADPDQNYDMTRAHLNAELRTSIWRGRNVEAEILEALRGQ